MGKKTIALLGVAVSAALIYFCIETKKDQIALKCNLQQAVKKITGDHTEVTDEKIEEVAGVSESTNSVKPESIKSTEIFEKSDPAFGVTVDEPFNVVGMFAPEAKKSALIKFLDEVCSHKECLSDLRYSDDIKIVDWNEGMIHLIQFMMKEHIQNGSIYVNSNILHIEGRLAGKTQRQKLNEIISMLKTEGLQVEDKTSMAGQQSSDNNSVKVEQVSLTHTQKAEKSSKSKKPKKSTPVNMTKVTKVSTPEEIQSRLQVEEKKPQVIQKAVIKPPKRGSKTLKKETTVQKESATAASTDLHSLETVLVSQFADRKNRLNDAGERSIDQIAEQLHKEGIEKIEINVFVHQSDDKLVNMIIAQKKANILKNAFRKKGFNKIVANGTGLDRGIDRIEINPVK